MNVIEQQIEEFYSMYHGEGDKKMSYCEAIRIANETVNKLKIANLNDNNEKANKIIYHYGIERQARQTMEECAELIQALNKYLRKAEEDTSAVELSNAVANIAEEIADVQIMSLQLIEEF